MNKYEIQFASLFDLWEYKHTIETRVFKFSFVTCKLSCECTEAEVELAINAFRAKVTPVCNFPTQ
jgi:hypothetical protein